MQSVINRLKCVSFVLLLILCVLKTYGLAGAMSSTERLNMADGLSREQHHTEAYNTYKEIAMTYRANMSKEDKSECLQALYGSINEAIALSKYRETVQNLILAEELRENERISDDRLAIYYSCLYISLGQDLNNKKMLLKCHPYALKAFDYGVRTKDAEMMQRAFTHLIACYYHSRDTGMLAGLDSVYQVFDKNIPDPITREVIGRYYKAILSEFRDHDYKKAAEEYDAIDEKLSHDPRYSDLWSKMMMYATESRCKAGEWNKAEKSLQKVFARVDSLHLPIYKQGVYTYYSYFYNLKGDSAKAQMYKERKQKLTDSISSVGVIDEFFSIEKMTGERELQRQIVAARYRSRVTLWIAIVVGFIAIGGIIIGYLLRRKNKSLTERARLLHQLLKEKTATGTGSMSHKEKYEGSTLSDEEKRSIAEAIQKVLDSDAIYSNDFSLTVLSEKVDKSSKAVSQVINETFGANFSAVINRLRIYEACRRIDSPMYENWSIEGIAESVGYTQRNTFSVNFKKFTGMGVREYRKLSKEDKDKLNHTESEE